MQTGEAQESQCCNTSRFAYSCRGFAQRAYLARSSYQMENHFCGYRRVLSFELIEREIHKIECQDILGREGKVVWLNGLVLL
jgi:hypothetical protein